MRRLCRPGSVTSRREGQELSRVPAQSRSHLQRFHWADLRSGRYKVTRRCRSPYSTSRKPCQSAVAQLSSSSRVQRVLVQPDADVRPFQPVRQNTNLTLTSTSLRRRPHSMVNSSGNPGAHPGLPKHGIDSAMLSSQSLCYDNPGIPVSISVVECVPLLLIRLIMGAHVDYAHVHLVAVIALRHCQVFIPHGT